MTIESIGEDIPQKVLDLIVDVFGSTARVISMDADHLWLQVHFTVHDQPVVLDVGVSNPDEITGNLEYKLIKLAVPDCKNLFVQADWKERFCDWGMEFERGRLLLLRIRLEGLLASPLPQLVAPAQNYDLGQSVGAHAEGVAASGYILQEPEATDTIAQNPMPRLKENSLVVRGAILVCFSLAGAATSLQFFKRPVAPMPVSTSMPVSRPSIVAPVAVPSAVFASPEPLVPTNCLTISTIATVNDRGLLPWLRTIKAANPVFFTRFHVTPQDLVTASIRPRHRAESAAHDTTNPAHALGEAHAYHFGQVQAGDRIFLQACPHAPVMLSYSRGATHLYNVQIDR